MAANRRFLGGYVSPQAHEGWHLFARSHDVDVSALLEAVGKWMAEQDGTPRGWRRLLVDAAAIREARARRPR